MKVHHVGVWASDGSATRQFYEGVMGFEKEREYEVPIELMSTIFGIDRSCKVEVYAKDTARVEVFDVNGTDLSGINHFSLSVGDRVGFFRRAKASGADCLEVKRGDHPVYFIRDPSGLLVEIKD
jgi:catechol 2,3-dioxygenase-like lactoylglutathione lyase family enzyme